MIRGSVAALVALAALAAPGGAAAYGWPLKPFHEQHPIRGGFGDPRYHVGETSQTSAFHFGVDIVARDGQRVYSVEPGYVRAESADVTVSRRSGRHFEYWHVRPVVHTGQFVRAHALLGTVLPGWGHVHFAESFDGSYKDPLRPSALTPFYDHTTPIVSVVRLLGPGGEVVDDGHVTGLVDIMASAYDTPQPLPPPPWQVARLAPAAIWWVLRGPDGVTQSFDVSDFDVGIPPNAMYSYIYAPGTYQNKPNRPGVYNFWLAHSFDTTGIPDGAYQLEVFAEDTRGHIGARTIDFVTANGVTMRRTAVYPVRGGTDRPE